MQKAPLHIVHTEASCGWGGQEIRILTEARGMMQKGHRITLLCPSEAPIYQEAQNLGLDVQALPIARKNLRALRAMRNWIKHHRVDIINTHSSTDTWVVALANRLLGKPPVMVRTRHISAPVPKNAPTRWLYTRAGRHIVTTGERLRETLINENAFPAGMITSIPTGIDTQRFMPGDKTAARAKLGLAQDKKIIGIIATLRSWKGHDYLIDAFSKLDDDGTHLLIVGDGPRRKAIEERIETAGIAARVTLPGNQRDVVPWLQALDILALPSYANEGVPQGILQAMCCALPVVSTPVGSITEAVKDGETGIIVEPQNAQALTQALENLLADDALRERLGRAGRERALERFTLEGMIERMEHIFYEALDN